MKFLEVVQLAAGVDQRLRAATRDVWIRLGILLLTVTLLAGLLLQRQVLRPLSRLGGGGPRRGTRHAEPRAVAGKRASGLAHEVGTPLNIVSGRAEFLLQALPPDDAR